MLNAKTSKNFLSPKNLPNFDLLGGLGVRGLTFFLTFTAKGTSFEPFCVKIGRWV